MADEWLSLTEAAELLGVHPGTLRRWSNEGAIASARTSGGHRRFQRQVIVQHLAHQPGDGVSALPPTLPPTQSGWQHPFEGTNLESLRHQGQRLLGLLLQYLTHTTESERFLQESRTIGHSYGVESAGAGLALLNMVETFLFFRTRFTEITLQLPSFPRPGDDAEMHRLHERIDRFMNEVLLGTIEGYEAHRHP